MRVKKFFIESAGDPSVGIPNLRFEVSGDFEFEDKDDLEYFRGRLEMVFGDHVSEMVGVETDEELRLRLEKEDQENNYYH